MRNGPEWIEGEHRWKGHIGLTKREARIKHKSTKRPINWSLVPSREGSLYGRISPKIRLNEDRHSNEVDLDDVTVSMKDLARSRFRGNKSKRKKS